MLTLLAFIFVVGVLITIHEAGHFVVARILGAPVEVFSVGFGKRLWGFERGGTDYRISLIPLGGYVRIIGLGPDESDVVRGGAAESQLLPRWRRALILLAGPVTNIVAAVLFVALAFTMGVKTAAYLEQQPLVGWVAPGSAAEVAGVREGDAVRAVGGDEVELWRDLEIALLTAGSGEITLTVEREGKSFDIPIVLGAGNQYGFSDSGIEPRLEAIVQPVPGGPAAAAGIEAGDRVLSIQRKPVDEHAAVAVHQYYDLPRLIEPLPGEEIIIEVERDGARLSFELTTRNEGGQGKIGVGAVFPTIDLRLAPLPALRAGFDECRRMTLQTFKVIGQLFTGRTSIRQMSGPVGIAQISGQAARSGVQALIMFMGVISLQLGIFNLLPIPILDGGHLTIMGFEALIRRDLPQRVKERILEVGFYLLILLMVVVTFNDIVGRLPESVRQFFFRG